MVVGFVAGDAEHFHLPDDFKAECDDLFAQKPLFP